MSKNRASSRLRGDDKVRAQLVPDDAVSREGSYKQYNNMFDLTSNISHDINIDTQKNSM